MLHPTPLLIGLCAGLAFAFLDPLAVLATPNTETPPAVVEAPEPPPPTAGELVAQVGQVVSDWRSIGALAGLIALINLLINILRLPLLHQYLTERKKRWIKPYISAALGAMLTGLSAYQTDAALLPAILAGLLFGLGAVGMHESLAPAYNARKREQ